MTSLQINGPWKDIATYAVSLQGTGGYGLSGTTITSTGSIIINGGVSGKQYIATGGQTSITWTDMIGKTCLYVSRGGVDVQNIFTSGTPTGNDVMWNSVSGVLTFGTALTANEFVRALFN